MPDTASVSPIGTPLMPPEDGPTTTSPSTRVIQVGTSAATAAVRPFCDNAVTTSKYTLNPISPRFLLWRNLYEQFHRVANIYFLFIAMLQIVPGISPTGRYTTIAPLSLVMFLSLLKDSYEDFRRHRLDAEVNSSPAKVLRNGAWKTVEWRDVKVGDVMRLVKGDFFPADLLILSTSEPEGICYIETASLDGETNLKIRKSCPATYATFFNPAAPDRFAATIEYELPNNRLYSFMGTIKIADDPLQDTYPLVNDYIFLRGAQLRNTAEAYGVVLFTGHDTKLMKNASDKRHKMSNIDIITNRQIWYIFVLQLILCFAATFGLGAFTTTLRVDWYLAESTVNVASTSALGFLTFLILFNNLIPISLYVSMEVVKLVQAALINTDVAMYYEPTDTPACSRTSALNEELGQVRYLFSDKTGTLTCNIMEFSKFSVLDDKGEHAVCYGTGVTEVAARQSGGLFMDNRPIGFVPKDGFNFYDDRISDGMWRQQPNAARILDFLRHLAVCHTVIAEAQDPCLPLVYQAASPDESCLVKGARELGATFVTRTENTATISVDGKLETYDILHIIEFDSTRKRMSVVVRTPQGKLQVLCKGADSVIFERLRRSEANSALLAETMVLLTSFASEGLRTLVIAKADINEPFYQDWAKRYREASCALTDRAEKMAAVGAEIEVDFELVGTTAIEDKLQTGVPQTIELLMAAGVRVWVLTGDKQETAINIGYACALLNNAMTVWSFADDAPADERVLTDTMHSYLSDAKENAVAAKPSDTSLVVQGALLEKVLSDGNLALVFLELATLCKSVICCRVSPLQKAQIVLLVRENIEGCVTMAIGDGANDVSMIQSADVGIGISGLEGLQAARASDYSIGQFRFLQRLLLVHGRWNYRRIARLILYSFYKNICLYLTQFWFCFFNGFSGQTLYDEWALAVYNVFFTAFPIMVLAVFDRDVEPVRLLSMNQFPDLYLDGLTNRLFNTRNFWIYVGNAIFHSAICFFIPMASFSFTLDNASGFAGGLSSLGVICYTVVVIVVSLKAALETLSWTWVNVVVLLGSIAVWFAFLFVYSALYGKLTVSSVADWYAVPTHVVPTGDYWLLLLLVPSLGLMRDFAYKAYRRNMNPELSHVVQTLEVSMSHKFCRDDVLRTHRHLLVRLETLEPKFGTHVVPQSSKWALLRTGFAFSQEEGQAEITKALARAFSHLRTHTKTKSVASTTSPSPINN